MLDSSGELLTQERSCVRSHAQEHHVAGPAAHVTGATEEDHPPADALARIDRLDQVATADESVERLCDLSAQHRILDAEWPQRVGYYLDKLSWRRRAKQRSGAPKGRCEELLTRSAIAAVDCQSGSHRGILAAQDD